MVKGIGGLGDNLSGDLILEVHLHMLANLGISKTVADFSPIAWIFNAVLEPAGVVLESILIVPTIQHGVSATFVGYCECKDDETDDCDYYDEHEEEVETQEAGHTVA